MVKKRLDFFFLVKKSQTKSCFISVGKAWLWKSIIWAAYSLQTSSDESLWLCRVQGILHKFFCCPKNTWCI